VPNGNPKQLLPSDKEPALFWVTHPTNHFENNVAAGGPDHCWWLAFPGTYASHILLSQKTSLFAFEAHPARSEPDEHLGDGHDVPASQSSGDLQSQQGAFSPFFFCCLFVSINLVQAHSCGADGMHIDNGPDARGVPGGSALDFQWLNSKGENCWASVGDPWNPVRLPRLASHSLRFFFFFWLPARWMVRVFH
jgi:hypothetical protein